MKWLEAMMEEIPGHMKHIVDTSKPVIENPDNFLRLYILWNTDEAGEPDGDTCSGNTCS